MPIITASIPVLNGEKTIAKAIEDLLSQTYQDFEIIVCDNASNDKTREIVEFYQKQDPRVVLRAFKKRVDIRESFKRAASDITTPYFMFAPADDRWYPEFMQKNLDFLEKHSEVAACTGRVAFFSGEQFSHISNGTHSLMGNTTENLTEFLRDPGENARLFSIIRTQALEGIFPDFTYPGWDFQLTIRLLLYGKFYELPDILSERDVTNKEDYINQAKEYFDNRILNMLPLHRFAIEILKDKKLSHVKGKKLALIKLIAKSHLNYVSFNMPAWHRIIQNTHTLFETEKIISEADFTKTSKTHQTR